MREFLKISPIISCEKCSILGSLPSRSPKISAQITLLTLRTRESDGSTERPSSAFRWSTRSCSSSRITCSIERLPKPRSRNVCIAQRRCSFQRVPSENTSPVSNWNYIIIIFKLLSNVLLTLSVHYITVLFNMIWRQFNLSIKEIFNKLK